MDDLALIRKALDSLPSQCRYHGDQTAPHTDAWGREACCDTGVAAQRRKLAVQALQRLAPACSPIRVRDITDGM